MKDNNSPSLKISKGGVVVMRVIQLRDWGYSNGICSVGHVEQWKAKTALKMEVKPRRPHVECHDMNTIAERMKYVG